MVSAGRGGSGARTVLGAAVAAAVLSCGALSGCGAADAQPAATPSSTPTPTASAPSETATPATPTPGTPSPTTATPTLSGVTLRQLGFTNGPLDEFTLPSTLEVSAKVDQPNVVSIVLVNPSPAEVEDYLRAALPREGFRIDARATAGAAMTFAGHGWTGGFTGTGTSSAVVLRPR